MSTPSQTDNDQRTTELLLRNLRDACVKLTENQRGSRTRDEQTNLDCISAALMSPDILDLRLMSSVERILGISRAQQMRGINLQAERNGTGNMETRLKRQSQSFGPKAKVDLDFVYDWFHNDCPLVEVDKSRQSTYTRSTPKVAGKKLL